MPKRFIFMGIFVLIVATASWLAAANWQPQKTEEIDTGVESENVVDGSVPSAKIGVISSLFPWYDLSREIGGDRVEAKLLLPPGVEAHAFEPTPSDMIALSKTKLFVYTGDYMEPWAQDILDGLGGSAPASLVIGQDLAVLEGVEHEHEEGVEEAGKEHSGLDPHIWLDPMIMSKAAGRLAKALAQLDPAGSSYYNQRLEAYQHRLDQLDEDYRQTLTTCKQNNFIFAGHYAFGYLASRYNLKYEAAQGFSPDAESSPQQLQALSNLIKTTGVKYIFAEELENQQLAEALAQENGVKILLLNSAHNLSKDDLKDGLSYLDIMRSNLKQLSTGLLCR
jgi:zinc transport system substrate-binding protein